MIEDRKSLPKPMFGEEIIPPEIEADMIINKQTGSIRKKKIEQSIDTIFHNSLPTMGSAFTPKYIQGNIECEVIKSKAKDLMNYGIPDLNTIESVFYRDMFPKNVRFQCSDCPHMSPFLYITDMISHGVKYHGRRLDGVLTFLVNLMDDIARR